MFLLSNYTECYLFTGRAEGPDPKSNPGVVPPEERPPEAAQLPQESGQ